MEMRFLIVTMKGYFDVARKETFFIETDKLSLKSMEKQISCDHLPMKIE